MSLVQRGTDRARRIDGVLSKLEKIKNSLMGLISSSVTTFHPKPFILPQGSVARDLIYGYDKSTVYKHSK